MVLKDGKVNWDIMKASPATAGETAPTDYQIALNSYEVTNSAIRYDDQSSGMRVTLQEVNHSGHGDFTQDLLPFPQIPPLKKNKYMVWRIAVFKQCKNSLTADLK